MLPRAPKSRLLGLVTVTAAVLLLVTSFRLDALSTLLHRGRSHYSAQFADASGIAPGDPVRIAGVTEGRVDAVRVAGDHAVVDLSLDARVRLGRRSTAALRLDTLLGQHSLALTSSGDGRLRDGATIPLSRTVTPFTLSEAIQGTATSLAPIDTAQLTEAFTTLSQALDPAVPEIRSAATGLSQLARTVSSRDQEVRRLFRATTRISAILASRSPQVSQLLQDSGAVLKTLDERRAVIRAVLRDSAAFSRTVTKVLRENQARATPGLAHLRNVVDVLRRHQADLDESLRLIGPYLRYFTNVSGNGRFFDSTVSGLLPFDLGGSQQ